MKTLVLIGFMLASCGTIHEEVVCTVSGCNPDNDRRGPEGPKGLPGENCSISEAVNGAVIRCQDNSVLIVNGSQGIPGLKGLDGADGSNGVDGQDGQDGQDGEIGETGEIGPVGPAGADSVYQITELIDPCGPTPGFVNEVLLKLANGQIVASFSSNAAGANTRLGVLTPGNYQTTDTNEVGKRCRFTITLTGDITNQVLF